MRVIKNLLASNFLCWVLYSILIVSIVAFAHHGDTIGGASLFATPSEVIKHFGGGDQASFVSAALRLRDGEFSVFQGGYSMFAPGLAVVEMFLISFSPTVPLPFMLLAFTFVLWAIFMVCLFRAIEESFRLDRRIAFIVPVILIAMPIFWDIYWWNVALMTESLSTPLFAIACIESWHMMMRPEHASMRRAIVVGLLFAMASYIRAQYDFVFLMFSAVSLALLLVAYYRLPKADPRRKILWRSYGLTLLFVFVAYNAAVLPYKVFYKKASTIVVIDYIWDMVWKKESFYANTPGQFFSGGGGHSICAIAPEQCEQFAIRKAKGEPITHAEYKKEALKTVLLHPFDLFSFKIPYFWSAWMADQVTAWGTAFNRGLLVVPLLMVGLLGIAPSSGRWRRIGVYLLYLTAMVGGSAGFSFIAQFEPRYLLPVKLFLYVSLLLGIIWAIVGTKFIKFTSIHKK